jgi:hypothetical protein
MKRLFATSAAVMLAGALLLLAVQGAPAAVSASGKAPSASLVAQARANFIKVMSTHNPGVGGGGGWVSPGGLNAGAPRAANGTLTAFPTLNWSGYADSETGSNKVSQVSGNWTLPAVQCLRAPYKNQDAFIVNWVGIDGVTTGTVEQLGTGAQCFEGVLFYYVWYEMFPAGMVEEGTPACISDNVNCPEPGDQITASVTVTPGGSGENSYKLTLADHTRPDEGFSVTKPCAAATCQDESAEWIVERPAFAPSASLVEFVPLVDFSKTFFTRGDVVSGGLSSNIQGFKDGPVYDVSMVDDSVSYYLACVGQPSPPGTILPITEASACPTVAPFPSGGFEDSWDNSF